MNLFEPVHSADVPSGAISVRQVIDVFLNNDRTSSARALLERKRVLDLFCASFGSRLVSECRPIDLVAWVNGHNEWASDWTRLRIVSTIQRPMNWASKLGFIDRNPFYGVSVPPGDAGRPMTEAEFRQLLKRTTPIFRRVLTFLRFSGCRPGEMSALEWSFIDVDRACAVLHVHKTARTRRDRQARVIYLHPVAVKLLAWIGRNQPEGKFIFLNCRGRPWNRSSLSLRLFRLRDRAGVPKDCKLYGLRHAFGTRAVLKEVELKTLSELMGHTTTKMTERYVHLAGQTAHLQAALRKALT